MKSAFIASALLAAAVSAAPAPAAVKRQEAEAADIDTTILNFALTLEHLEAAFYKQGLAKFNAEAFKKAGFKAPRFYKNLQKVGADEADHVTVITSVLSAANASAVKPCEYNFGFTTPRAFVDLASILEGVGVSAYLGAAASITSDTYLTAAASILSVEARHNAWVRREKAQSPFPQAFDTPLGLNEVFTLAAGFIKSCPRDNPELPVKAYPALTVKSKGPFRAGKQITFSVAQGAQYPSGDLFVAFPAVTGPVFVPAKMDTAARTVTITIPQAGPVGPAGQAYPILTSNNNALDDSSIVAGPAIINVAY